MTTVYFIRHAEADNSIRDGRIRPLTDKGLTDRKLVTEFLQDKNISAVFSSPLKHAVDTVADFAVNSGISLLLSENFKEHDTISDNYPSNKYFQFVKKYWADFHYKVSGNEMLLEVQERNITALNDILAQYKNKNIVIGTHGTALSTIINYYENIRV
jgi:2,3-bisphosphoglycerate-dependent phosphoglycerate mutase